jgi:hypothetical protein
LDEVFGKTVFIDTLVQATQKTGKPIVIKKGRQVGATMMAGALDIFFTNSDLYTNMRILHAFPALHFVKRFSQDKLEGLIRHSKNNFIEKNGKATGYLKIKRKLYVRK